MDNKIYIQVGSATCENAGGAQAVCAEFKKQITSSGREDIKLRVVGCTGKCSSEPIVTVFMPDGEFFTYHQIDAEKARKIFVDHILENKVVAEYLLQKIPTEKS